MNLSDEEPKYSVHAHEPMVLALRNSPDGGRVKNMNSRLEHLIASRAGLSLEEIFLELLAFTTPDNFNESYEVSKVTLGEMLRSTLVITGETHYYLKRKFRLSATRSTMEMFLQVT